MPKEEHHEHLYSRLPDLHPNLRTGIHVMGKPDVNTLVHPQTAGTAVQDGNKSKKGEVNKMILKKETEEIIENFIAEQLQDKTISPEMVAAIARLIETLYA